MKPEHVVSIILALVTVLVVAGFLIAVIVELRRTHLRLITILGAVVDTVDKTDGLESVVNEIANDLAYGQSALADCVDRLEQRLTGQGDDRQPNGDSPSQPSSDVYTNY